MITYGTSALPSTTITAREKTSTAVSLAFDASVGIVGGYDASANLSSSEYDVNTRIEIEETDQARELFGENSELYRQVRLAFLNGAGRVVCVPVGETQTTESVTSSSSISLSEVAIDPRFNPEHEITATDTSAGTDISVTLVDGTPSTPSNNDELNLNPQTGEGEFGSSGDYDVTYTHGDYDTAGTEAGRADVRFLALCHADPSVRVNALSTVLNRQSVMDLKRLVSPIPTAADPSNYTIPADEPRLVLSAPTYGTAFDDTAAMTTVAEAAQMASEELGSSATGNNILGFQSFSQDYSVSDVKNFGSPDVDDVDRVTVIYEGIDGYEIVEDLTTSTGQKFRDVYRCEIIDDIAYNINLVTDSFIDSTEPNTEENRQTTLEPSIRSVLRGAAASSPPLLGSTDGSTPYTVSSSAGSDDETVNVTVGIDVIGLTKQVDVDLGVGAINSFLEVN